MNNRTVLLALAVALCATPALGTVDVAIDIVRPDTVEAPGLVPVSVRLRNLGDTYVLVESVQVTITDWYNSFVTGFKIDPGLTRQVFMPVPWVCPPGSEETCTAWITYPEDMNHHNDTDVVIVNRGVGLSEGARTAVSGSPGHLNASIARATCFVIHTEPLNVTLFDVKGRAVLAFHSVAAREGKSAFDLRGLRSGVYLARLDDGRRSSLQKFVVQR